MSTFTSLRDMINSQDMKGNTPLHLAARDSIPGMLIQIVEVGADTSIKNNAGHTAGDIAIAVGHREAGEWLNSLSSNRHRSYQISDV